MPPQIICAAVLSGKTGNTKIAVFTRCVSALQEFNQSLLDFFNLFDSRLILKSHAAVWLPESYRQCIQLGAVGGMVQEKGSQQHRSSWTVLHAQCMCSNALSSWKKKYHLWWHLIESDICWDSKVSHWYSPLTFTQTWRRTTPIFYTATDTVTDHVLVGV